MCIITISLHNTSEMSDFFYLYIRNEKTEEQSM